MTRLFALALTFTSICFSAPSFFEQLGQLYDKGTMPDLNDFPSTDAPGKFVWEKVPDVLYDGTLLIQMETDSVLQTKACFAEVYPFYENEMGPSLSEWSAYVRSTIREGLKLSLQELPSARAMYDTVNISGCLYHQWFREVILPDGRKVLIIQHTIDGSCPFPLPQPSSRGYVLLP